MVQLRVFSTAWMLQQTTLEAGHETYKQWVKPTIPMYKDFYIFNLTNPKEFADGAKPKFDELGPYRYRCVCVCVFVYMCSAT